jgi:hypothetical protein
MLDECRETSRQLAKLHQNAPPLRQKLARMPIRSRDNRFAGTKTVGQRTRSHLRFVEIGRRIHIAHRNEVDERCLVYELIQKHDMIFNAELSGTRLQALTIDFAITPHEIGMCRAQYNVNRVGAALRSQPHRYS